MTTGNTDAPRMYETTTRTMTLQEADWEFAGVLDLSVPLIEPPEGCVLGLEMRVPEVRTDFEGESEAPTALDTLFIWLPNHARRSLQALASRELWTVSLRSRNLQESDSFVVMGPKESGLYISLWRTNLFCMNYGDDTVRVVLIGADAVVDVRYRFTGDDLEAFQCDGQAQTAGTGPNHYPSRSYTEEELLLAANLGDGYANPGYQVRMIQFSDEG